MFVNNELKNKPWNSYCTFTRCKSKRASVLERETSLGIVNAVSFMRLSHFFSVNSRNMHFFEKCAIKIEEHKILILISKPLNSPIKTGTCTMTTYLSTTYQASVLETLEREGNMFVPNTLAWQISCRACSRFYSWVVFVKDLLSR